jgi:TonB-dependent starch-binding outer membrane protein SusC
MRSKFKWIFTLLVALTMQFSYAQEKTITGIVTDASGPVPGVNVFVKGTQVGTSTNFDGSYSIKTKVGETLVFTFLGMKELSILVEGSNIINPRMTQDRPKELLEVVIVGYGTQKKKDVTGAISSIQGDKIKNIPVQSFDLALSGAAAGVNVSAPNGVLGNAAVIRIRGVNSISLSSYPLIVIDGVPSWNSDNLAQNAAANNPLADINPADIESFEILKDAASAAIYGSRASAGVILITTKKGKLGKAKVNFETSVGFSKAFNLIDVLGAVDFTNIKNEGLVNFGTPANGTTRGFYTINDANGNLVDTNWYDYVYRTGMTTNNALNISGATENTKYFFSLGHMKQEGIFVNNDFKRNTGRFTLDHKVNNTISVGGTFNYTDGLTNGLSTGSTEGASFGTSGAARLAFVLSPNVGPFKNDGSYNIQDGAIIGFGNNKTPLVFQNVKYALDNNKYSSQSDHIVSNVYVNFKIFKGLNFKSLYGIDNLLVENKQFRGALHGDGFANLGDAQNTMNRYTRRTFQNTLDYNTIIADKHSLSVLLGTETQYSKTDTWGANRTGVADPFYDEYQAAYTGIVVAGNNLFENYLRSVFSRLNYDYAKKYYLSINARRDGYSAFAPGSKYGNFSGASVGWSLSEENFLKNSQTINLLKLRASYGVVGNNQGIDSYAHYNLFSSGLNGANATLFYSQAGNANITWETSKKSDFGINFGLFKNRLSGELGYYKNDIDGLILDVPQAPSTGIPNPNVANTIIDNVGSMYNKGYELTLNAKILTNSAFRWNVDFNITSQENKITALGESNADILRLTSNLESTNILRVGESTGSFYAIQTGGVNPDNGRRIFYYRDGTAVQYDHSAAVANRWTKVSDGTIARAVSQQADGVVVGPALPTYFGGLTNTFMYKGLDLNISLYFSGGNYIYNGTKAGLRDNRAWNNSTEVLDRWQKPGDVTDIPKIVFGDNISNGSGLVITENIEKGDFIKFRNISLGYNFPEKVNESMGLTSLRVYFSVQNAFTITKYTGFDPEISTNGNNPGSPSVDRNSAPMARSFNFGMNISL